MSKQIIVIGIYRSGTSLIGGVLAKLGIDMGRHENLADPIKNPSGYFECFDCMDISEKLRQLCGGKAWFNVDSEDSDKIIDNPIANEEVASYIDKRNFQQIWGLKDPKMIPFYPIFSKYLHSPYLIFISRNKESVITSWKKIIKPEQVDMVEPAYERHLEMINKIKAEAIDKEIPILELDYSWYVDNREEAAKKIAYFVGLPVTQEAIEFCRTYSRNGNK